MGRPARWLHAAGIAAGRLQAWASRLLGVRGRAFAGRAVAAAGRTLSAYPALCVGALFALLFTALYALTATRGYTFDAVAYALQIRRFEESGEWRWLFHPHHILFNTLGLTAHRLLRAAAPGTNSLGALQAMNALLGGLGLALFAAIAARLSASRAAGAIVAAGLGVSYGYWVCGTDGRVNIAGVVVLIAAAGLIVSILDPDHATAPGALDRGAAGLGALNALAALLHQSHLLFVPAAVAAILLSPGRPRARALALYLGLLAVLCLFAYRQAAFLAAGALGVHGIGEWATTYAHRGIWWSMDVQTNLHQDVSAFTHALIARTDDAGLAYRAAWVLLASGIALTAARLARLFGRAATRALAQAIREPESGNVPARPARPVIVPAPRNLLPEPEEAVLSPAVWVRVPSPAAPLPRAFTPLALLKRRPRPAAIARALHRLTTRLRAWWRIPAAVRVRALLRAWATRPLLVETRRSLLARIGASERGRSLLEHPPKALRPADEARLRLAPVLLIWMASYATFFTFWNPGYFVFWVPLLVPFWLLIAIGLARGRASQAMVAVPWAGMGLAVVLMAAGNGTRGIAPQTPAVNNARLQKALAAGAHVTPRDTFILAGAGDYADGEVYVPYFAGCEVLSLESLLAHGDSATDALHQLQAEIDRRLAGRGKVYVHEELISSEGPYRVLAGRHGITRAELVAFLHRHYRLGRPARWTAVQ